MMVEGYIRGTGRKPEEGDHFSVAEVLKVGLPVLLRYEQQALEAPRVRREILRLIEEHPTAPVKRIIRDLAAAVDSWSQRTPAERTDLPMERGLVLQWELGELARKPGENKKSAAAKLAPNWGFKSGRALLQWEWRFRHRIVKGWFEAKRER
jgi:hypothetical protein